MFILRFNLFSLLILALIPLLISGCASEPKVVDNTPTNATVVLNAEYVINGYLLPDSRGKQTVYTRGDRRRIDQTIKFDSWVSKTFFGNGKTADIARLDRNLMWMVDVKKETYVECAIKGCSPNILAMLGDPNSEGSEAEVTTDPQACETELKVHDFTVKSTGETRVLNGFTVARYDVDWRIEFEDKEKRKDKNNLHMELWTTEPTTNMKQAWKTHEEFQQGYLESIGMNKDPLRRFVGQQVYMALAAFTGDTAKNKSATTRVGKQLAKITGYPVSIKMELYTSSKACPDPKKEKKEASFDKDDPLESAKNMLSGFFSKKAKEYVSPKEGEPYFRYIYEVKSVNLNNCTRTRCN